MTVHFHECAISQTKVFASIKDILKHVDGAFNAKGHLVFSGEVKSPEKVYTVRKMLFSLIVQEQSHFLFGKSHVYELSNLKLRYFIGKSLSTLPLTDIKEIDAFETQAVAVQNF